MTPNDARCSCVAFARELLIAAWVCAGAYEGKKIET